jgi:hypothetical protein
MAIADGVDGMGPAPGRFAVTGAAVRPGMAVAGSVLAFTALIDAAGYVPAVMATIVIASYASPHVRLMRALALAAAVAAALAALFIGVLDQPMPLFAMF